MQRWSFAPFLATTSIYTLVWAFGFAFWVGAHMSQDGLQLLSPSAGWLYVSKDTNETKDGKNQLT